MDTGLTMSRIWWTHLVKLLGVLCLTGARFIWEGLVWEWRNVVGISTIFDIFEDNRQVPYSSLGQEPDIGNEAGYAPSSKRPPRESEEEYLVTRCPVVSKKCICFSDIFRQAVCCHTADPTRYWATFRANSSLWNRY